MSNILPMPSPWAKRLSSIALALVLAGGLAGCSGYFAFRQGRSELAEGKVESGLVKLKQAVEADPQNPEYRQQYFVQRENAVNALLQQADWAMDAGRFDEASELVARAKGLDGAHPRTATGANRVEAARRQWSALDQAVDLSRNGDLETALAKVQWVLSENPKHVRGLQISKQLMRQQADKTGRDLGIYPRLRAAYRKPVSLSVANASLLQVFDMLKQASGLNYVLDKDVRQDLRVTLSLTAKPVEDVLRLLLATNQLERRVLDEDTLLIYPNTAAKATDYKEMVVRSFYLSNADPNKVAALIRTIAKAKDVVVDEKLNLVVVRDGADVVRLAEKLIATHDMAEPEVMLELEVLEVSASRLMDMGISWPSSASVSVVGSKGAGQLTWDELRNGNSSLLRLNFTNPAIAAQLRSQTGDAHLLANPRVRVRNKQTAKILIGERVPVFTTVATANVGTTESVNYLDVGLKLEIEPTVSLDSEVSMKLSLEVSNVLETITRASGTQAYRLGTRNTSTSLRVKDGETNVLAGLIEKNERRSNTGVPGLNELPLVSKLFGASQGSDTRTEIVLLVTPHIVRNVELPGLGMQEFLSGTDAAVGALPIQLGTPNVTPVSGAAQAAPPKPAGVAVPPTLPPGVPQQGGLPAPMPPQIRPMATPASAPADSSSGAR